MALVVAERPEWQPVILKARKFLISLQASFTEADSTNSALDGGIGYGKGDKRPDLSNTSLALGPSGQRRAADLARLGVSSEGELAEAIRSGAIDDRSDELHAVLVRGVAEKLAVANPRYFGT